MDILFYTVAIAAFLLFLVVFITGNMLRQVMSRRISTQPLQGCERTELPEHIAALYQTAEQALGELGFHYSYCFTFEDTPDHNVWHLVFEQPRQHCYATISPNPNLGHEPSYAISFSAGNRDGLYLSTLNGQKHLLLSTPAEWLIEDPYTASLEDHWCYHLAAQERLLQEPILTDAETSLQQSDALRQRYFTRLTETGRLKRVAENEYRLRLLPALRFIVQLLRGQRRLRRMVQSTSDKSTTSPDPGVAVTTDIEAFQQFEHGQRSSKLRWPGKLLLSLVSLLVFVLVFRLALSWEFLLILLSVLLFHEGGHLLAMWWFGYRDLNVLFIPALGAVATARQHDVPVYQKAIVSLAGPIPGLLLGAALLYGYWPLSDPLLLQIVVVLLALNYFNLLPLLPLDGGQLLAVLLFRRHPRIQVAFLAASIILLLAVAWTLQALVLGLAALLLLLSVRHQWRNAQALLHFRQALKPAPNTERESLLAAVFTLLRGSDYRGLSFARKIPLARYLLDNAVVQPIGKPALALCLTVYLSALILPAVGIIAAGWWPASSAQTQYQEPDWEAQLAAAQNTDERWQILIDASDWFYEIEDDASAARYAEQAAQLATHFPVDDIRHATVWLHQARTLYDDHARQQRLMMRALALQERLLGSEHPDLVLTLQTLAQSSDDTENAVTLLERALAISRKHNDSISTHQVLYQLAWFYERSSAYAQAEATLKQLIPASSTDSGTFYDWLSSNQSLVGFYQRRQRHADAIALLEQRVKAMQHHPDKTLHAYYHAETLRELGWTYLVVNDNTRAVDALQQALEATRTAQPALPDGLFFALLDTAYAQQQAGKSIAAKTLLTEAGKLHQDGLSIDLSEYRQALRRMDNAPDWRQLRQNAHIQLFDRMLKTTASD